jgi:hypothetical protein
LKVDAGVTRPLHSPCFSTMSPVSASATAVQIIRAWLGEAANPAAKKPNAKHRIFTNS